MTRAGLAAIAILVAQFAQAQDTVLVPSKTWSPDSVPKSPSEVVSSWSGGMNAVAWWVNLYADSHVKGQVKKVLDDSIAKLTKDLEWTGEGALLQVRLIRTSNPNSPLKAVGILGDQAWYAGTGRTAEDALFAYWKSPQLRPGIPDGWAEDPLGSNYFWVTLEDGKPHATVVPRGLAADLDSKLTANFSQYALDYYKRAWQATDTWLTIAQTAKSRLASQAAKKAIDTAWADVKASQARVSEANGRLERAIEAERKAADAMRLVQTLQGILTVAQLVQEVRTTMNESVPELSSASTAAAVVDTTTKVHQGKSEERVRLGAAFDGTRTDLQKFLGILGRMAKDAGAPPIVDEKTTIDLRPRP